MRKCKLMIAAIIIPLLSIAMPVGANDQTAAKPRIEREFRQLEAAISRVMYNSVLPAGDVGTMNRRLYEFMRENPSVMRILRTNAAGISVNDVSSGSPLSEASRNLSGQRWLQYVTQYKMPYYSMDADDATGEITIFYAWPLMTGADRTRFSGAFAAMVDFTAHVALIDNVESFQLAYNGRAFFEHEWENVDWNEEPLDIRGVKGLSIRTEKPLRTRDMLPPAQQRRRAEQFEGEDISEETDDDDEIIAADESNRRNAKNETGFYLPLNGNILIAVILSVIAIVIACVLLKRKITFVQEDDAWALSGTPVPTQQPKPPLPAPPPITTTIPVIPPQPEIPVQPAQPDAPQPKMDTKAISAVGIDEAKLSKMLTLIKNEFAGMNKKIEALHQRIEALEKR